MLLLANFFSEQERVDAFMNPQPMALSKEFLDKNRDVILLLIAEIGVSYPTEISRSTGLHIETVNKMLQDLKKEGLIRKIRPDHYDPQEPFQARIVEFWEMGLDNYSKVASCSWWIVTVKGIEHIQNKYHGEKKQLHKSIVKYYGLELLP